VATVGAAEEDRWLIVDQPAATADENGWTVGEARPLLLATAGRESSDVATVWKHGAADRRGAGTDRIGRGG